MSEAVVQPDGRVLFQGRVLRAALGRGGVVAHKMEGDQATPCGLLPLRHLLYRADRLPPPRCRVLREPIAPQDGWCDAPTSRFYNTQISLPHDDRHESLWRQDAVYDVIGVLGWNDAPVERHRGSAIFLHVARPDYAPTEGCVALALPDLLQLLADGLSALRVVA
jgi:L,D-peptidoglycan transpeptidase YkuD (ErfK/YbiS/YcfS/YnhG family)